MPAGRSKHAAAVEAVDIQARALYQRTCEAGSRCDDVSIAVRSLHAALGDLLLEADDPNSLINAPPTEEGPSIFSSQLKHILEDCEYTLWQVRNTVDKHYTQRSFTAREEDAIGLARFKIANQVSNVSFFLDTVREPTFADMTHPFPQPEPHEDIYDVHPCLARMRVGAVQLVSDPEFVAAYRSGAVTRRELCRALHREVMRDNYFPGETAAAIIPDLISQMLPELKFESFVDGTSPFLVHPSPPHRIPTAPTAPIVPPKIPLNAPSLNALPNPPLNTAPFSVPPPDHCSPKELMPADLYNEKFDLSVKQNRPTVPPASQDMPYRPSPDPSPSQVSVLPQPELELETEHMPTPQSERHARSPTSLVTQAAMGRPDAISVPSPSSDSSTPDASTPSTGSDNDSEISVGDDLALMSTRDLMDFDLREQESFAARVGVTYLYPQLMPAPARPALPAPSSTTATGSSYGLSTSTALTHPSSPTDTSLQIAPSVSQESGVASADPRYVPPLPSPPPYQNDNENNQQRQQSSIGAFGIVVPASTSPAGGNSQYMLSLGLAPDSHGNVIPPEAIWTRINRRLVSPEVLERAGVRYEARPNFVAILGRVSRPQIAEYARQSAAARRARKTRYDTQKDQVYGTASSANNSGSRARRVQPNPVGGGSNTADSPQSKAYAFAQSDRRRSFERSHYPAVEDDGKGTDGNPGYIGGKRIYPFIVSPPSSVTDVNNSSEDSGQSPRPRSILKNKNINKLRYKDGKTIEVSPEGLTSNLGKKSSRSHHARDKSRHRDRDNDRRRDRDRDREQSRDRTDKDRSRYRDKDRGRDHDSDYDRDKGRDRSRRREERNRTHDNHKESDRDRRSERAERTERDRNRTREHDHDRDRDHDYEREKDHDYTGRDKDRERKRRSYDDRSRDEKVSTVLPYRRSEREPERERERERERESDRERDRYPNQRSAHDYREQRNSWESRDGRDSHDGNDNRDGRDGQKRREDRTRLRDAIGAAGIGGAAASLFTVISEAAQGL